MPAIPYVKRKIGNAYLIWYQPNNQYILLEEPAWFVFRKILRRFKTETIALEIASRYGVSENGSLAFV